MAVSDSDAKSRAILEKQTKKGEEYMGFQEAQGQLMNIQAERQANLNQQRALGNMEMQNNQSIAQAAEILAASGGGAAGGMAMAAPQKGPNSTQGILNKFGIGKPGTKSSVTTQTSNSPQKIQITNNNTTTNNIQVSQPQIPMQAPVIPMRTPGGDNTDKFKVWVSNAFAKQNEAAAIRDKEYQKREWSLTRSANKMIRKMGELGKAFAEKMNPKNVSNMFGDQLKVVMWLMGFQLVVNNIGNILKFVENISGSFESLRKWFTGDGEVKSFSDFFTKLFGGKVGKEGGWDAFKNLAKETGKYFRFELEGFFDKRGTAIKAIPKPDLDLTKDGLSGSALKFLGYLGDVVKVGIGGSDALKGVVMNQTRAAAQSAMLEEWDGPQAQRSRRDDIDTGDYVVFNNKYKRGHKMSSADFGLDGNLRDPNAGGVKMANYLNTIMTSSGKGPVQTLEFGQGLKRLYEAAQRNGKQGVLVGYEFLMNLGEKLGVTETINKLILSGKIKKIKVRLVAIPKSVEEKMRQGEGIVHNKSGDDAVWAGIITAGVGIAIGIATGGLGFLPIILGASAGAVGAYGLGVASTSLWPGYVRRAMEADKILKIVRSDDKAFSKYQTERGDDHKLLESYAYTLTVEVMNEIASHSKIKGFKWNMMNDPESLAQLDALLVEITNKNNALEGTGKIATSGIEQTQEQLDKILQVQSAEKAVDNVTASRQRNLTHATNMISNLKLGAKAMADLGSEVLQQFGFGGYGYKEITDAEAKNNSKYIMNRLIKELDLSPVAAAGIAGNLGHESGKWNPTAVNSKSNAQGLAQWLGDRKSIFTYGRDRKGNRYSWKDGKGLGIDPRDASLKDQVDFIIWELTHTHKAALEKLRNVTDIEEATRIGLGHFEFSAGYERAIEELKKHGDEPRMESRYNYAQNALNNYNNSELKGKEIFVGEEGGNSKVYTDLMRSATDRTLFRDFEADKKTGEKFTYENFKKFGITEDEFNKYKEKWEEQKIGNPHAKITESDLWRDKVRKSEVYIKEADKSKKYLSLAEREDDLTDKEAHDKMTFEEETAYDLIQRFGPDYNLYDNQMVNVAKELGEFSDGSSVADHIKSAINDDVVNDVLDKMGERANSLAKSGGKHDNYIRELLDLKEKINKLRSTNGKNWWKYLSDEEQKKYIKYFVANLESKHDTVDNFFDGGAYSYNTLLTDERLSTLQNYIGFAHQSNAIANIKDEDSIRKNDDFKRRVSEWTTKMTSEQSMKAMFGNDYGFDSSGKLIWDDKVITTLNNYLQGKINFINKTLSGSPAIRDEMLKPYLDKLGKLLNNELTEDEKFSLIQEYTEDKTGIDNRTMEGKITLGAQTSFLDHTYTDENGNQVGFWNDESFVKEFGKKDQGYDSLLKTLNSKSSGVITALKARLGIADKKVTNEQLAEFLTKGNFNSEIGKMISEGKVFKQHRDNYLNGFGTTGEKLKHALGKIGYKVSFGDNTITVDKYDVKGGTTTIDEIIKDLDKAMKDGKIDSSEMIKGQLQVVSAILDVVKEVKNEIADSNLIALSGLDEATVNNYLSAVNVALDAQKSSDSQTPNTNQSTE